MTMIAYAFLQSRRLQAAGRKKRISATTTKYISHQASDPRSLRTTSTPTMASLPKSAKVVLACRIIVVEDDRLGCLLSLVKLGERGGLHGREFGRELL
jgi:Flp pilus assembly protein TadB